MQLAACELEAIKSVSTVRQKDDCIAKCMEAHGYEFHLMNKKCDPTSPIFHELHCYRPDDWVGQAGYAFEANFSN